jgi:hypothetical protein
LLHVFFPKKDQTLQLKLKRFCIKKVSRTRSAYMGVGPMHDELPDSIKLDHMSSIVALKGTGDDGSFHHVLAKILFYYQI